MYKLQRARGARADHTDKAAVHGKWRNGLQKTARIANSTAIITKEQGIVFALPWLSVVKEESEKTHNSKVLSIRDLQRFCWPPDSIWKERAKAYCSKPPLYANFSPCYRAGIKATTLAPRLQDSPAAKSALFSVRWRSHPWPSSLPLPHMPGQSWPAGTSPCVAQTDTSSWAQALGISPHLIGPAELAATRG